VSATPYPKRLIEVDLPIRRISAYSLKEKSKLRGHISTLHLWWARRPTSACRAVTLAALSVDPADPACSDVYRVRLGAVLARHRSQFGGPAYDPHDPLQLRAALLAFVGDFANPELASHKDAIDNARAVVQAAHVEIRGEHSAPTVLDPFAGGGSFPLEAVRLGATTLASDLNPVPVLLNKIRVRLDLSGRDQAALASG
jgi:putative DNA methylase